MQRCGLAARVDSHNRDPFASVSIACVLAVAAFYLDWCLRPELNRRPIAQEANQSQNSQQQTTLSHCFL